MMEEKIEYEPSRKLQWLDAQAHIPTPPGETLSRIFEMMHFMEYLFISFGLNFVA